MGMAMLQPPSPNFPSARALPPANIHKEQFSKQIVNNSPKQSSETNQKISAFTKIVKKTSQQISKQIISLYVAERNAHEVKKQVTNKPQITQKKVSMKPNNKTSPSMIFVLFCSIAKQSQLAIFKFISRTACHSTRFKNACSSSLNSSIVNPSVYRYPKILIAREQSWRWLFRSIRSREWPLGLYVIKEVITL
jgi:hypothetical protein